MKPVSQSTPNQLPVFVYGTLRPGEKNYPRYLEGRTVREVPASVEGELFFVRADGGYPYVLPGEGTVRGELVEIVPELYRQTLRELDELEEYDPDDEEGSVYLRRVIPVRLEDGRCVRGWIYTWNRPELAGKKIGSGDFKGREL